MKICENRQNLEKAVFEDATDSRLDLANLESIVNSRDLGSTFLKKEKLYLDPNTKQEISAIIKTVFFAFTHYLIVSIEASKKFGIKNVIIVEPV